MARFKKRERERKESLVGFDVCPGSKIFSERKKM